MTAPVQERSLEVVADELRRVSVRLAELEDRRLRAKTLGPNLELEMNASRLREQVKVLQVELDGLRRAEDERVAAERARREAEKAAARPGLLARREQLEAEQVDAYLAIEAALDELVSAIEKAVDCDVQLQVTDAKLEERRGRRALSAIENRISRRLRPVGIKDLFVIGKLGLLPLAEPPAEPRRRERGARGAGKAAGKAAKPQRSTGSGGKGSQSRGSRAAKSG